MKHEKFQPTPAYLTFLRKLRLARQEKGVSQRELARRVGIHWSRVIRSESGARPLDIVELRAYCEALEISVVEFSRELDAVLNAMEAEAANPADDDAPTSTDDDSAASTTPPSSPS